MTRVSSIALAALLASSCGLVLDFDPDDAGVRVDGSTPPEIDAGEGDARRDGRRDGRPELDVDVVDAEVDAEPPPQDMGPIDPDASCSCDPTIASACVDDRCVCGGEDACGDLQLCCPDPGMLSHCVSPKDDPLNCGGCGIACGSNASCFDGRCECDDGFVDCDAAPGCETDPTSDPMSCGGCGMTCNALAPSCLDGMCASCTNDGDCRRGALRCLLDPTCETLTGICLPGLLERDACLIDGACVDRGEPSPAEPCLICDPDMNPFDWTPDEGQSCDDGRDCTHGDQCDATGECRGDPEPCDDSVACTEDRCDVETTGLCQHRPMPGFCADPRDDRMCIVDGESVGADLCNVCNGTTGELEPAPAMTPCDDADRCNGREFCDGLGRCTSASPAPACEGVPPCFERRCNPTTGLCDELMDGFCFIDGTCRMDGALNPENPCLHCDADVSPRAWRAVDVGMTCRVNATCSVGTCSASGLCSIVTPPCTEVRHQTCDPATGECTCLPGTVSCDDDATDPAGCECLVGGCTAAGGTCMFPATT